MTSSPAPKELTPGKRHARIKNIKKRPEFLITFRLAFVFIHKIPEKVALVLFKARIISLQD